MFGKQKNLNATSLYESHKLSYLHISFLLNYEQLIIFASVLSKK